MHHINSIIAITGRAREIDKIHFPPGVYDKIHKFPCPDDHGEFPDMGAYETRAIDENGNVIISHDWEQFQSHMEDSQLYPYMLKCADAVTDYLTGEAELLERLGMSNIMTTMNGHKFGGRVFAVAGFVRYQPPYSGIGQLPVGQRIFVAGGK